MSRNNQDRFGDPLAPDQSLPQQFVQQDSQQTPLSYVVPTELVDIPSKGKFYPPEHPLHNKDQIEIRHMTAKDEDILVNQSYLKKGVAIDKLLGVLFSRQSQLRSLSFWLVIKTLSLSLQESQDTDQSMKQR